MANKSKKEEKPVDDSPRTHDDLDKKVHDLFDHNGQRLGKRAHGKQEMEFAIESEVLALDNENENLRIVLERTKEGATVPEDFDLDYTVRVTLNDLGVVVSVSKSLEHGLFTDMYIRNSGYQPVEAMITDDSIDRVYRYLNGAKVVDYVSEIDEESIEDVHVGDEAVMHPDEMMPSEVFGSEMPLEGEGPTPEEFEEVISEEGVA